MRNADVDSLRQQIHTLLTQKQGIAALNPLDVVTQGHITVLTQLAQAVQQTALDPASIAQIGQMLQQYANAAPPSVSTLAAPQPLALPVLLPNQGFPSFSLPQFPPATGGFLPLAQQSLLPANLSGLLGNTDLSALLGAINPGTQLSVPSQPQALPVFGSGKQPDHMDVSGGANATPMGDQREHGQGRNDGVVWSVADLPRIRLVHEDLNK
ncbi:hypothetical protein HKX48_004825 [Thoreauomyces humboldtii]|nr:hypothetical protein HKX48_004825 [Thoreauomyces humboldtii]